MCSKNIRPVWIILISFCYKSDKHQCQQWKSFPLHWLLQLDIDQKSKKLFLKLKKKNGIWQKNRRKKYIKRIHKVLLSCHPQHLLWDRHDMKLKLRKNWIKKSFQLQNKKSLLEKEEVEIKCSRCLRIKGLLAKERN